MDVKPGFPRFPGMPLEPAPEHPVLFFDGVCGLCNLSVDFILARDKRAHFRFSPLQGETAAKVLKGEATSDPSLADDVDGLRSLILWDADGFHRRSEAALRLLRGIGGIWSLAAVFRLVPRPLRDLVYDFVAKNRYKWFGKREACRMPAPNERALFLP